MRAIRPVAVRGLDLAENLVASGTPQDLELAEKVLDAALNCQERREGDPHYGNFFWMREDDAVGDLNAVEFNLERLIPMMLQHGDRLSPEMRDRVLESIRLGLEEIRSLNVLVAYSNITMLDILNTCLGGELLGPAPITVGGARAVDRRRHHPEFQLEMGETVMDGREFLHVFHAQTQTPFTQHRDIGIDRNFGQAP